MADQFDGTEIAIIGLAGRFPGAKNIDEFWRNLRDGVESISFLSDQELEAAGVDPASLRDPNYVKAAATLDDAALFDAAFFGFTPKEAELMDPQHRIFLECASEALEHASYDPHTYPGLIGVYGGATINTYLIFNLASNPALLQSMDQLQVNVGNSGDFLTTRVSYKLNLKGPSHVVQSACSTSLVAVHLACQSLLYQECDMVLAGGVSVNVSQSNGYRYIEGGIVSPDGRCRAFDAAAEGTIFGSGVGVVVLKRLEDALADGDYIHAVIKGSAINNDGSLKVGYTAPSVDGQAQVIIEALSNANLNAEAISYIEAHGTGTPLGDPIEIQALTKAFRTSTSKNSFCAIGSVKTNIGHLDAAAGVTGLIKTILALKHRQLPPSLHFERPNPAIDFASTPFFVNDRLSDWPDTPGPRRAGISSFGVGGTNAHVILQEAPPLSPSGPSRPYQLLALSAKTGSALEQATEHMATFLREQPELNLPDMAYTLHVGRRAFKHRRIAVCNSVDDAIEALATLDGAHVATADQGAQERPVIFLFSGQGAQYVDMALGIYQSEPTFRLHVDRCCNLFNNELGIDLLPMIYPTAEDAASAAQQLEQTMVAQAALFTIEYALTELWRSWGVQPQAMIGHSIGEYVAACVAGVFSLEDAVRLVAQRGRLMQECAAGEMIAVLLAEAEIQPFLNPDLSLAAINGPSRCVVSGPAEAISKLDQQLTAAGVQHRSLHTSHAFHSPMMEPIIEPFIEQVKRVRLQAPKLPYISNVTGTWITAAQATDPDYWARHLRQTVRFDKGLAELFGKPESILLEIGPGRVLSTFAQQHPNKGPEQIVLSSVRHVRQQQADAAVLMQTLGQLWIEGAAIDWAAFYSQEQRQRLPLPTYPFEHKRYWVEAARSERSDVLHQHDAHEPTKEAGLIQIPEPLATAHQHMEISVSESNGTVSAPSSTRRAHILSTLNTIFNNLFGIDSTTLDVHMNFLEMGVDSLLLLQLNQAIKDTFGVEASLRQLFEELNTLDTLVIYIDQKLPPEALVTQEQRPEPTNQALAPVTAEAVAAPAQMPVQPLAGAQPITATGTSTIQAVVEQQLQLMAQQLELLRMSTTAPGATPSPTPSAEPTVAVIPSSQAPATNGNGTVNRSHGATSAPHAAAPQSVGPEKRKQEAEPFVPYQRLNINGNSNLTERQQQHVEALIQRYTQRTQGSKRKTQAHRAVLANNRSVAGFRPDLKEMIYQILAVRADGARIWDVDDNEYIDLTMGFGVYLFGHDPRFIRRSIEHELTHGVPLGPFSHQAGQVAELISELTGVERVTFFNTGSEAVMVALRLARAVTGRTKIAIFAGAYHGTFDGILARAHTASQAHKAVPMAPGVTEHLVEDVLVLNYGTPQALEAIKAHAHELAAVLVEPVQSRRPDLQPKDFLHEIRQITAASGTAFIFDEVITGFRIHPGGAQAWFGIQADMAIYGKVVGGGLPIGVVAGKATYLDSIDGGMWSYGDESYPPHEEKRTFVAGTFCQHPLAMASALAVLQHLKANGPALQEQLNRRTTRLTETLNHYFEQTSTPIRMVQFGSLFRFVLRGDLELLFYHLLDRGIYIWEGRNCFLSTAHTDADVDSIIQAVKESVEELRAGGFLPALPPDSGKQQAGSNGHAAGNEYGVVPSAASPSRALPTAQGSVEQPAETTIGLTEDQQQLWVLTQLSEDMSAAYNESVALRMKGPLDLDIMRRAMQQLVSRHEALRTRVGDDGATQEILPELVIDVPLIDLSATDQTNQAARIEQWLADEAKRPFDLAQAPLVRVHVLKEAEQSHLLALTIHHIIADGWSIAVLLNELAALYSAACQHTPIALPEPIPFRAYVRWQEQQRQSAERQAAEAYWRQQFESALPLVQLPADGARPLKRTYAGARRQVIIDAAFYDALKQFSRKQGASLFMTLLTAFKVLLHRLSEAETIVVGVPSAGQSVMGAECLIGQCVSMLPIASEITADPTFSEYLSVVKRKLLDAHEHQDISFTALASNPDGSKEQLKPPQMNIMFNLDRPVEVSQFFNLQAEALPYPISFVKFDLSLNSIEVGGKLQLEFDYATDLVGAETIERWVQHFETLLRGIMAQPQAPLSALPLLTSAERHTLLDEWSGASSARSSAQTIPQLFEAQAAKTPDASAVIWQEQSVSYAELDEQANQIARHLQQLGVGGDTRVYLTLEYSVDLVAGLLGVLKAGGSYIWLDPEGDDQQRATIIAQAEQPVFLTRQQYLTLLPKDSGTVVCLDTDRKAIARKSKRRFEFETAPEQAACVIYAVETQSQALLLSHAQVVDQCLALASNAEFAADDRVLLLDTNRVDAALEYVLASLFTGACLVIPASQTASVSDIQPLVTQSASTVVAASTHAFKRLSATDITPAPRCWLVAGRPIRAADLAAWQQNQSAASKLLYSYAPANLPRPATIWSSSAELRGNIPQHHAPLGRPLVGHAVYILDRQMEPVPIGVPGDLYLGNVGSAGQPIDPSHETAPVNGPQQASSAEALLLKTGDIACFLADGSVEVVGQRERQIHMRGNRISVEEIEASLDQHPDVQRSFILSYESESASNEQCLTAYVVPKPGLTLIKGELRHHLKERLPEYQIPAAFVVMDSLPLLADGSVDHAALPQPTDGDSDRDSEIVGPRTAVEEILAEIWSDVLAVERVSVYDNFFEAGGQSLLATQFISRVCDAFDIDLPLRAIVDTPVLADLAQAILKKQAEHTDSEAMAQLLRELEELSDDEAKALLGT